MAIITKLDPGTGELVRHEVEHKKALYLAEKSGRAYSMLREYHKEVRTTVGSTADGCVAWYLAGPGKGTPTTVHGWKPVVADDIEDAPITELRAQLKAIDPQAKPLGRKKLHVKGALANVLTRQKRAALKAEGIETVLFLGWMWHCSTVDKDGKPQLCPAFGKQIRGKRWPDKHILATAHVLKLWDVGTWLAYQTKYLRDRAARFGEIQREEACKAQHRKYKRLERQHRPAGAPPPLTEEVLKQVLGHLDVEVNTEALEAALIAAAHQGPPPL